MDVSPATPSDILRLQDAHSSTARELKGVRNELSIPAIAVFAEGWQEVPAMPRWLQLNESKEDKLERLLAEIWNLPGFEGFLSPPSLTQIQGATKSGPIVVIYLDDKPGSQGCAILIEQHGIRDTLWPSLLRTPPRYKCSVLAVMNASSGFGM